MQKLSQIEPKKVFKYFEEISKIPRGSGNMEAISAYCVDFAKEHNLKYIKDNADNVIIYKDASKGYEDTETVILQGHMDMVCQKTDECKTDFEKDGIDIFVDGEFIKAKGTTLGADNGIAMAMILSVLEDENLEHPSIEAVFTTDEEVGMIGASKLDVSLLKGKKMINLDSEEERALTVSCAGGSDVKITLPTTKTTKNGTKIEVTINGLKGGHSGVEIDKGRVNANILMGRVLNKIKQITDFDIIEINGGTKRNAIPLDCKAHILVDDESKVINTIKEYFGIIKEEIRDREPNCNIEVSVKNSGDFDVLDKKSTDKIIYMLIITPNGIESMSKSIEGLVETSLNLGVLKTDQNEILMQYALRSNKKSALDSLEEKMFFFADYNSCGVEISGRYEPWEYNDVSQLREVYVKTYEEKTGKKPSIEAIHAGLECAVFSGAIKDLDSIAIGPDMFDVHTVNERLSIPSTKLIYEILCDLLKKLK